ncbi:MAG: amino acid adenylation domain-containing protein, partial [Verrucomicrobia bacterium]
MPTAGPHGVPGVLVGMEGREPATTGEAYWRESMAGFSEPTRLAIDRGTGGDARSATIGLRLPKALTNALGELARETGVTVNTVVQGAWALLLARYSGTQDVVFGVTRACRHSRVPGSEHAVGFFMNTLPMRIRTASDPRLGDWLREIRRQHLALREFERTPIARIREWIDLPKSRPLFESLLVFENHEWRDGLRAKGGRWLDRRFRLVQQTGLPLTVGARHGRELDLRFSHDTRRLDAGDIGRMAAQLRTVLEGMVADPSRRLSEIPIHTAPERHQLLAGWNDTTRVYPRDRPVQWLFEQQRQRTPDAVAIVDADRQLTYRELDALADGVSDALRRLGAAPGQPVGLWGLRSAEIVAGLLGILKSGAAYVPLPPDAPPERVRTLVEDAGITLVVAREHPDWIGDDGLPRHVPIVGTGAGDGTVSAKTPSPQGDALACILYTSGTTGVPKGACVAHRGLVNLLQHRTQTQFRPGDFQVGALTAPLHFDGSIVQIFSPLITGGTLVIADSTHALGASPWYDRLTALTGASSVVAALVHQSGLPKSARVIGLGAEPVPGALLAAVRDSTTVERLLTGYGVTECSCYSTDAVVHERNPDLVAPGLPADAPPPNDIGRPIANTRVLLLDAHRQPVPIGVPGEIYIGGDGVGPGYWNRPESTAERFVPDPFEPGRRLFRTGDQARRRPDGSLEFLGRLDHQIKLRGFRIEPGEIESLLARHPGVRQAVVLVNGDPHGDGRLAAYVVPATPGNPPDDADLRHHLQRLLPAPMIPADFVSLDELPLTSNGKVDRKALPVPRHDPSDAAPAHGAPRTPLEEMLAGIWTEVLGRQRVGIHDDFFDLGGHSLLAMRVLVQVRRAIPIDLPLKALFENPTLSALAARIEAARSGPPTTPTAPLRPVARDRALPLSFAQQRLWFLDRMHAGSAAYHIPHATRLRGPLDVPVLARCLEELVRRHEILRTTFAGDEGEPGPAAGTGTVLCPEIPDLGNIPPKSREAEARRWIAEAVDQSFDLSRELPLKARLLRLDDDDHVFVLVLHHIASDGWSMGILWRELADLYDAFADGRPSPLAPLPLQYADYAVWQREWFRGDVLEEQLAYWRRQLAGAPPLLELPTDFPRPAAQRHRGARRELVLDPALARDLRDLGRREGATLFMTVLAAWQLLLARLGGQDDVVVGTPIAGRNRAELEGLIGFFVNTLALRTDLSGNPTFRELLRRVRETTLAAYAQQDLPFGKLVEELQPERNAGHAPLFQVLLVLQNTPRTTRTLRGIEAEPIDLDAAIAKFDLNLTLLEEGDGLRGALVYDADLFAPETIARWLGHLDTLLRGIVADPLRPIAELPLLSDAERHQMLVEWNTGATPAPGDRCLHELFEDQAGRTPDAVAVVFGEESLTYAGLNQRANRLAHHLISLGIGPDAMVGLRMGRSVEMIVGMLAILKAGGAYVPLDPRLPAERLDFMLGDLGNPWVLARETGMESRNAPDNGSRTLDLVALERALADAPSANHAPRATPGHLAYVLYTSGSTGRPKGVLIEHRQIHHYLGSVSARMGLGEGGGYAMLQPLAVDSCLTVVFPALTRGGTLHLVGEDSALDAAGLSAYFLRHRIDYLKIAPSHLAALLDQLPSATLLPERALVMGGEALHGDFVERLRSLGPRCALWNHYGPTETTVGVSMHPLRAGDTFPAATVPIGRPLDNVRYYILDAHDRPVPIGVPGELWIGGGQVGRGYLNRPELTAERFVPDPHGKPGDRAYKSGDRAKYLPDGSVEFLGRSDDQIKIRGFRVELGEITTVLRETRGVREAVVLAVDTPGTGRQLVAYVVGNPSEIPDEPGLRRSLSGRLPDPMVPSAFVFLDALPLTPHGKVDRKALPAPMARPRDAAATYIAPRDPAEELLAGIW